MSSQGPSAPGPPPVGGDGGHHQQAAEAEREGAERTGLAAVLGPDFSVAEALGGPRGVVEAVLPSAVFLVAFTVSHELRTSVIAALVSAGLAAVVRLVGRESPMQALAGLAGVAVCALFASRSGEARNFYAPGLLTNVAYAAVYALSTLRTPALRLGRVHVPAGPWPALGLALGLLTGEGLSWKQDRPRLRAYVQVTWIWVVLFVVRLAVQGPLYLLDEIGALGVARLVMGFPFFGVAAYLTWRVVRRVPVADRPDDALEDDAREDDAREDDGGPDDGPGRADEPGGDEDVRRGGTAAP